MAEADSLELLSVKWSEFILSIPALGKSQSDAFMTLGKPFRTFLLSCSLTRGRFLFHLPDDTSHFSKWKMKFFFKTPSTSFNAYVVLFVGRPSHSLSIWRICRFLNSFSWLHMDLKWLIWNRSVHPICLKKIIGNPIILRISLSQVCGLVSFDIGKSLSLTNEGGSFNFGEIFSAARNCFFVV